MGPDFFPPLTNFINILSFYPQLIFRKALPFNLNLNSQPLISWSFQVALLSVVGQLLLSPIQVFVPHLLLAKTKFSQTCSPTTPAPRFSHSDGCSQSNTIRFSQIPDPEQQPGSHRQVFQDPQRAMERHPQPTAVPRNVRNLQQLQPTTYYGITTHLQPANGNGMNND